jgi:hypothetical protein
MFRGTRYRMPANEFAVARMEVGKQWSIQSMEEARDWERLFIGEVKAGRDPRRPRTPRRPTDLVMLQNALRDTHAVISHIRASCSNQSRASYC